MEENSRQTRKKQPFLYIVMVCVYHRRFGVPESNWEFMCYAIPIPFLFVYLKTLRQELILFSNKGMLSKITWVVCAISSFGGKKTPDEMMPRKT